MILVQALQNAAKLERYGDMKTQRTVDLRVSILRESV
jgi:hypothetical protein